jgi:AraC-like DNA-binding protein
MIKKMILYTSYIVAVGMFLAAFLAAILLARSEKVKSNRFLAALALSVGISVCYGVLFTTGLYRVLPHLVKCYIPPQFLIGPLLYFYVVTLLEPEAQIKRSYYLHFIPFILSLLYLVPFFAQTAQAKIDFVEKAVLSPVPSRPEEWFVWLYLQASLWVYSLLALKKYLEYRRRIEESVSEKSRYTMKWLLVFFVSVFAMLAYFLAVDVLMLAGRPLVAFNSSISILLSLGILFLGWRNMLRIEYIAPITEDLGKILTEKDTQGEEWGLRFKEVSDKVRSESLFLSAELTLPELADKLSYSRTELSRIINVGGGMSFYDFINKLRVEEMKARLDAPEGEKLSILEAAFDSGFNSKSTFQEAFKKWNGMTPSAYRKRSSRQA